MKIVLSVLCFGAICALAQDEAAFTKQMKEIDQHAAVIRKLAARTDTPTAPNAEKLAVLYENMKTFWQSRNVEDAVKWSEDGRVAALALVAAAKAGDGARAEESWKLLGSTCRSCHTAHREKLPDGTYRIK
jgi:hypothetical protein